MKLLFHLRQLLVGRAAPMRDKAEDCALWFADPLSHPAIERMSQRDLADLPFHAPACQPRR